MYDLKFKPRPFAARELKYVYFFFCYSFALASLTAFAIPAAYRPSAPRIGNNNGSTFLGKGIIPFFIFEDLDFNNPPVFYVLFLQTYY